MTIKIGTKENLTIIKKKDMEFADIEMEINIKDNIEMIYLME